MERTTLTERLRQVEAEIAAGRAEQALAACQELQTAYPRALRVQRTLGQIYLALRRPREALATLDRALAGDPEDVRACCARALVHQMHGDDAAALAWYRRACDLRPDDQALRATYRDLARRLGEPPYRPSRAGLARLYLRGDLLAHALREWEQLVTESPDRLDAQVGLAETLWIAGRSAAAEDRCRRILANAPSCVKAMLIQMALALSDGDMDAARSYLERTLQLDPDMTIAQIFFSDALAAGDPVMIALLRPGAADADAETTIRHPTAGFAQSAPLPGQRNLSRPLVTSAPHTGHTGGPAIPPPHQRQTSQPLPPPPRPDVPVPSQPTEVTRAFRETAFMIWDEDDDSQPRLEAQPPRDARNGEPGQPALRALSDMNDDEERRRAMNWYNWLQSQGAVALRPGRPGTAGPPPGAPPTQAPGTTGPLAPQPSMAPENGPASRPATTGNLGGSQGGQGSQGSQGGPANGAAPPLPPAPQPPAAPFALAPRDDEPEPETAPLPSAESLRTMFAELGGNTAGPAVVESPNTPPSSAIDGMRAPGDDAATGAAGASEVDDLSAALWPPLPSGDTPDAPGDAAQSAQTDAEDIDAYVDAPVDAPVDTRPTRQDDASDEAIVDAIIDADEPPHTLEDLERQFTASGFTPIAPRPGMLAEMEHAQPTPPASATQAPAEASNRIPEPATPASSETREPREPVAAGPDPRDYPARLTHARQRRDDGRLDEALNEYRAIIKNAPDLLSEVLSDLRASLEELPDHPNLHSVLGDALVCQGDYEGALEAYNRATALAQARNSAQP